MNVRDPLAKLVTAEYILKSTKAPGQPRKTVFTNGCFDLLHRGHVDYLLRCKSLGSILVVGLNSDESVRRIKGEERPVNRERDRAFVLAALECVDFVLIFEQDTPLQLIRTVQPDVLVKGGDWPPESIVGGDEVRSRGGEVYSLPLLQGFSTTELIREIASS